MQKNKYTKFYHVTYDYGGKLYYDLSLGKINELNKTGVVLYSNPFKKYPPEQMTIKHTAEGIKVVLGTLEDLKRVAKNRTKREKKRCNIIPEKKVTSKIIDRTINYSTAAGLIGFVSYEKFEAIKAFGLDLIELIAQYLPYQ